MNRRGAMVFRSVVRERVLERAGLGGVPGPQGIGVFADIEEISRVPQFGELAVQPIDFREQLDCEFVSLGRLSAGGTGSGSNLGDARRGPAAAGLRPPELQSDRGQEHGGGRQSRGVDPDSPGPGRRWVRVPAAVQRAR